MRTRSAYPLLRHILFILFFRKESGGLSNLTPPKYLNAGKLVKTGKFYYQPAPRNATHVHYSYRTSRPAGKPPAGRGYRGRVVRGVGKTAALSFLCTPWRVWASSGLS